MEVSLSRSLTPVRKCSLCPLRSAYCAFRLFLSQFCRNSLKCSCLLLAVLVVIAVDFCTGLFVIACDRPVAQAVSLRPISLLQARLCGICGAQSGTGTDFLWILRSSVSTIPPLFHTLISFTYYRRCLILAIDSVVNGITCVCCVCLSVRPPARRSVRPRTYLPTYLPTYLLTYLLTYLPLTKLHVYTVCEPEVCPLLLAVWVYFITPRFHCFAVLKYYQM
jgi:hypothetical protein